VKIYFALVKGLSLPEAGVLLKTGGHDLLVLLTVDGTGRVDEALQTGKPETVVQAAQLEGGQGGQTSLLLLLVSRGVVPQAHHT